MRRLFWPAPLLRHILLLSWLAGIVASRLFWPGLAALALLTLHQEAALRGLKGTALRLCFLGCMGLAFGAGALYAGLRAPGPPEFPAWLQEFVKPGAENNAASPFRAGLGLRAVVQETRGQTDRSLRILLREARALGPGGQEQPLPGKILFTWQDALTPEGEAEAGEQSAPAAGRLSPLPRRPVAGDTVELQARLRELRGFKNPDLWDREAYWAGLGVHLRVWSRAGAPGLRILPAADAGLTAGLFQAAALRREELRLRVLAALPREDAKPRPGAELLPALLFGDKYLLTGQDADLFALSTLAHSLALSGLHLGYAAALGYLAALLLYKLFPGLGLRLPRQKALLPAGLLPALLYLWLGGASPPLLRAFLMLLFAGIIIYTRRAHTLGDALLWAASLIALFDPSAVFELSLQLSAISIAAIALFIPILRLINKHISKILFSNEKGVNKPGKAASRPARALRALALIFLTSLGIQLVLAPLLVRSFGLLGLALPLNLLWLPILGGLVMPTAFLGLLASALELQALAGQLFYLASLPCGWALSALRGLEAAGLLPAVLAPRPHWLSMLGYWFILSLIPGLLSAGARKAASLKLLCGLLLLLAPWGARQAYDLRETVRLRLLDVGHGQAVLLEWQGGKRLLLDGGGSNMPRLDPGRNVVAPTLASGRFPDLDYMLASHLDTDHAQGLLFPLRHLPVRYYADNGGAEENALSLELSARLARQGLSRKSLGAGDVLWLDRDLRLEFLHPAAKGLKGNNASLVARLVWRERGLALLCGDVEKSGLRALLRRLRDKEPAPAQGASLPALQPLPALQVDALLLPHHGSANSLLPEFYRAAAPRLALVSAAYAGAWNFPSPLLQESLRALGIPLLNTAEHGQIELEWTTPQGPPAIRAARRGKILGLFDKN